MKILVASDFHLDHVTAGVPRFDDLNAALDDLFVAAVESRCEAFLMLGDLCDPDTTRSHRAIAKAIEFDRRLALHHIEAFWIAGNHDVIEDGCGTTTMSPLAEVARVAEEPYVTELGAALLIALPFTSRSHAYDPAEFIASAKSEDWFAKELKAKRPVIIAGHLNIEGIGPGSETTDMPRGRDVFFPLAACREHFPDALLMNGHYHKQQVFNDIHIPGSLERLTFGEEHNAPGYLIVEVES